MSSEWMKVMLDEIARKKLEAEHDRIESERRRGEQGADSRKPSGDETADGSPAARRPNDSA